MADRPHHQAAMATQPPGIVVEIVGTLMGDSVGWGENMWGG
jgi:hypothetical protein